MKNLFIIGFLAAVLFLLGCKQEPSSVDQELEVDALVEQQAAFGWQANQIVQTGFEIEEVTRNSEFLEGEQVDTLYSTKMLKKRAIEFKDQLHLEMSEIQVLYKPLGDTIFIPINKPLQGKRGGIYYYAETGILRFYEVKYDKFAPWQTMTYDSTEIIIFADSTLWDPSDDMLQSLHRTQHFRETVFVHVQSAISDLIVTHSEGPDITGVELTQNFYYYPGLALSHLGKLVDINPDLSGTLREDFTYSDGKTAYRSVTFNSDYTGSFEKKFRDNTMVSGTFNSVEDDLQGAWTELIDFSSGRYLDKIEKAATVEITLPDSIFNATYSEIIYFSSGDTVSSDIEVTIQVINGFKTTVIDVTKRNGGHGTLTAVEQEDQILLTGNWITWNGYYIEISDTQLYFDGGGHIHYEVWVTEDSYNNGDMPIIRVDYYFSAGGDGNGTIAHEGESYQFTTNESGKGTLSKDRKSKEFNLVQ
ncbi:hypothetical protein ACFLSX_04025 [Calditrichota bacterium]